MTTVYQGNSAQKFEVKKGVTASPGIKVFALVLCGLLGWMTFAFGTQLFRYAEISRFTNQLTWIVHQPDTAKPAEMDLLARQHLSTPNPAGSQTQSNQSSSSIRTEIASLLPESRVR